MMRILNYRGSDAGTEAIRKSFLPHVPIENTSNIIPELILCPIMKAADIQRNFQIK